MGEKLKVGLIGAGANTRLRHIPGFEALDDVEIVVVANRTRESAEAVARDFGIPRVAGHWEAVAEDSGVDAVCIGTWPNLHAPVTLRALEAGKHVLTEARVAMNGAEAQQLRIAADRHPGQVVQVVPSPLTLDLDATIIRLLDGRQLGQIREIRVAHTTGLFLDPRVPITWRQRAELSGHNMLTLGIYHEAVERWFGALAVARVRGWGRWYVRERPDSEDLGKRLPVDVPDSLSVDGELDGGGRLQYFFSGMEAGPGRNEIEIIGSAATLRVDVGAQSLLLVESGGSAFAEVPVESASRRGWRVEADFVESVRKGTPVRLTSLASAERYMRFTDAVHRSVGGDGAWATVF